MEGLTIAHAIPYIGRAQGGPVVGLAALASAQAEAGYRVAVFCAPRPADGPEMPFAAAVSVRRAPASAGSFRWCPAIGPEFAAFPAGVAHVHGMWTDLHRRAAAWARRKRIPCLVAPCGMLDAAASERALSVSHGPGRHVPDTTTVAAMTARVSTIPDFVAM